MKILIRFSGEIAIKSPHVRRQFLSRLVSNIQSALKASEIEGRVRQEWGRLWLDTEDASAAGAVLKEVFGIRSFSQVEFSCPATMDDILATGAQFLPLVEGRTFAVRAKRSGRHPFSSVDVQRALGALLNTGSGKVCLTQPEITITTEIRDDSCYFFSRSCAGPGGLPLGTGGQALCLMSGGFDSPVAAWMIQKRGVCMDYLFCNLAGAAYERSVLRICRWMARHWSHGTEPRLHVVDFHDVVSDLRQKAHPRYYQVLLKRLFFRAGNLLARESNATVLVTGEAIAQVSSQTLKNLAVIDEVAELPVLRPLVAYDKEDIVALSRMTGTHDMSSGLQEFCQLTTAKPATACSAAVIQQEESLLDASLLFRAVQERRILKPKDMTHQEMTTPYIYQDSISGDYDLLVDCRTLAEYEAWHYPGAQHIPYDVLMDFRQDFFNKEHRVLIYCDVGMQSAILAEKMQTQGYQVYSLRGGCRKLQKTSPESVRASSQAAEINS